MHRSLLLATFTTTLASIAACAPTGHTHSGGAAHPEHVQVGEAPAPAPAEPAVAEPAPAAPADKFTEKLPTGVEIAGNLTGVESKLVAFIKDDSKPVDKSTWFSFDRLLFKTGSAELEMDVSRDQLQNIAEILKAYPKVELKIGGYTDNTGSAATNKTLSQKRADNVAAAIVAMGIDKARLSPEGYGPEHPVCPANDTEECRAQNRRIDVRVKAK